MNGYQKAQQMNLTGDPDEIVDQLQSISLHHRNVYITGGPADTESVNLLHLLTARHAVMTMGSNQQWQGPLIDLEASDPVVAQIMSLLRPHLQVNDTMVYCALSDDAADMLNALTEIVGTLTGKPAQVVEEVALLSGGRIGADYATLTANEYSAQKSAAEAEAAKEDLREYLRQVRVAFDEKCNVALAQIASGVITTTEAILTGTRVG